VPLICSGLATPFYERYNALSAQNVLRYMIFDEDNASSIHSCLWAARESARSVRGGITSEMYEDLTLVFGASQPAEKLGSTDGVKTDRF